MIFATRIQIQVFKGYYSVFSQGVPQANLALINIPVTLVSIIGPVLIRRTEEPLTWLIRAYVLCLITALPIAAYVHFTPRMIFSSYYYPLLILLLACGEFAAILRPAAIFGFYASICEPRIGGTYITFLVTMGNLGASLNSSAILYIASWLPKRYAFVIAVAAGIILGSLWLALSLRTINRLQKLPIYKWHLRPERNTSDAMKSDLQTEKDQELSLISNKDKDETA